MIHRNPLTVGFANVGILVFCFAFLVAGPASDSRAQTPPGTGDEVNVQLDQTVAKGVAYLLHQGQNRQDGSFSCLLYTSDAADE